jgi:hypothetical protein
LKLSCIFVVQRKILVWACCGLVCVDIEKTKPINLWSEEANITLDWLTTLECNYVIMLARTLCELVL